MIKLTKLFFTIVIVSNIACASKIVSVGGSITETIVALGHGSELIGVDQSSVYPKELTSKLPSVGYWLMLPQEGILSLKPEIVFASSKSKPKKVIKQLKDFGIKTYIIEDNSTLKSAKNKIRQIGNILGEEKKVKEIITRIEKNVLRVQKEIKGKRKPKVLFVFSRGEGVLLAAGSETKPGAMIKLAGGVNATNFKQYSKVSSESILKMNPDVIIKTNHGGKIGLDESVISSTNAGKNKQIYSIDMLLISGFTVRVDEALEDLSCMFNNNKLSYCK